MKKLLTIALCAAMILSMTACGAEAEKPNVTENGGVVGAAPFEGETSADDTDEVVADETPADPGYVEPDVDFYSLNEIAGLEKLLIENGIYRNHYPSEDNSDFFEHSVAEYWVYELTDGSCAFLRLYDSEETAKKEASNYKEGDPSHYSYEKGKQSVATIIDYAFPVWMWQYRAAIIEFGSSEPNADVIVKSLSEKLGDYFAGCGPTVEIVPVEDSAGVTQNSQTAQNGIADSYSTEIHTAVDLSSLITNAGEDTMAVVNGRDCDYEVVRLASVDIQYLDKIVDEPPTLISTFSELESYRAANKEALSNDESKSALGKYGKEYFDSSSVLLVPLMSGNLAQAFRLNEMKVNQKYITLEIEEDEGDEDALDFQLMIVGLKNVKFDKLATKIKANRTVVPVVKNPLICDGVPLLDRNPDTSATNLDYKWEAIRTNGDGYPRQMVITDSAALAEYYEHCSAGWFNVDAFKTKIDGYTDEWFKNNSLIIVAVEYGSGSTKVFADSVVQSGNDITVTLRTECPEVFTCDMAGWQVFIETSKLTGSEKVTVAGATGTSGGSNLATE